MTILTNVIVVALFGSFAIFILRAVFDLPPRGRTTASTALAPPEKSPLVQAVLRHWQDHPGKTGVTALRTGSEAFAARILLANAAVSSIDAQYYIWRGDLTGTLLLDALRRAADRGVRVRLLLDDNGTSGLDSELASLATHENIEVRLYNPFNLRRFKPLSYTFNFFRLNRRMHNKSFTIDGAITILGGRNIGDEYFDTGASALFVDLDVMVVGKAVGAVAKDFDRYWAARAVWDVGNVLGSPRQGDPLGERLRRCKNDPQFEDYTALLSKSDWVARLTEGTVFMEWTDVVLVSDDPVKGLRALPRKKLLAARLSQAVGTVRERIDGVSPYLVPGAPGVDALGALVARGVTVRMLTNALEATDVLPVHAGYAKHRRKLLKLGVGLFELQRQSVQEELREQAGPFGSSGASLHAKTFAVDGKRIFIGSFNFDPRSIQLNTEMGLLIDSPAMANEMHAVFDDDMRGFAWRVTLDDGALLWRTGGTTTQSEPGATPLKRLAITVIGLLPVEWLL